MMTAAKQQLEQIDILTVTEEVVKAATKKGATACDAIIIDGTDVGVTVRQGKTEHLERSESTGIGLRVMVGKRQAMVSASDFRPETINELVERAVVMARLAPEDPYASLAPENRLATEVKDLDLYDANEPSAEELLKEATELEALAVAHDGITNSEGADASYGNHRIALVTSHGFAKTYKATARSRSVSVLAGEGTGMERDYSYSAARHGEDLLSLQTIADEAAEKTLARLNPRKVKTASVPVIYDPRVARELLGSFASAINGAAIARGTSFLKEEMGKQLFNENIRIINDPLMKRGYASKPFDAEGVQTEKLELVSGGVLSQWLLAMRAANQLKLETNGCASRGLSSAPSPSTTNLYMENGTVSPEELMSDIKSGLYLTETFGMGINLVTGDYSQGAAGFWIENGEIAYPVSEITIASHLKEIFKTLTPANDLEFRYGTNAPTLRVEKMTVAGV